MPRSFPPALERSLDLLRCPACGSRPLRPEQGALRCPTGHTFDIARYGYASLLTGTVATSGDNAAMVQARDRFLATGSYAPIRQTVARLAADAIPEQGTVVDVGCGTGYYLAGVLDQLSGARGLGLDTSVRALRSAARAHDRAAAATWDVFRRPFPLEDRTADVVLDVFAPRNPSEFHRVLRPTGRLIVARPTERHLAELRRHVPSMVTIDPVKEERLQRALDPHFHTVLTEQVEYPISVAWRGLVDLLGMSPSARHLGSEGVGAPSDGGPHLGVVTVSVLVSAYRPRG